MATVEKDPCASASLRLGDRNGFDGFGEEKCREVGRDEAGWNFCKKRLPWWPERPPSVGVPCAFGLVTQKPVGECSKREESWGKVEEKGRKCREKKVTNQIFYCKNPSKSIKNQPIKRPRVLLRDLLNQLCNSLSPCQLSWTMSFHIPAILSMWQVLRNPSHFSLFPFLFFPFFPFFLHFFPDLWITFFADRRIVLRNIKPDKMEISFFISIFMIQFQFFPETKIQEGKHHAATPPQNNSARISSKKI